ncbi:hypothetical protein OH773_10250 [Buttiauxella sp. WJP83]|uniref:hypothetical protein n=1 Tax=Buttiauxella sp. WJP83 TaxID=2986951 RepID=UPI0022DD5E83|nr:hypothetical protein [Buttiauxella sp. WJP83]WBM72583.1 hypothetical protein OH773_10250 [Buttiauxella sp. WJP83]
MPDITGFALDHWVITGWIPLALLFAISQSKLFINGVVRSGNSHIYEIFVNVIVGAGSIWVIVSAITILKNIWLSV